MPSAASHCAASPALSARFTFATTSRALMGTGRELLRPGDLELSSHVSRRGAISGWRTSTSSFSWMVAVDERVGPLLPGFQHVPFEDVVVAGQEPGADHHRLLFAFDVDGDAGPFAARSTVAERILDPAFGAGPEQRLHVLDEAFVGMTDEAGDELPDRDLDGGTRRGRRRCVGLRGVARAASRTRRCRDGRSVQHPRAGNAARVSLLTIRWHRRYSFGRSAEDRRCAWLVPPDSAGRLPSHVTDRSARGQSWGAGNVSYVNLDPKRAGHRPLTTSATV